MARPLIGITTYGRDTAGSFSLPACYVDAVRRAGGSALLLAPGDDSALVALAGTLMVHLPERVGARVAHRVPPRNPTRHDVDVVPNTRLAAIIGLKPSPSASWHHQAIDRLGRGLSVTARAADGTIEAVELPDHTFLIAVQWHPEITAADQPDHQALFDALVEAAQETEST